MYVLCIFVLIECTNCMYVLGLCTRCVPVIFTGTMKKLYVMAMYLLYILVVCTSFMYPFYVLVLCTNYRTNCMCYLCVLVVWTRCMY